jgi:hypothetical protein
LRFIARNIAPPPVNGSLAGPAPTGIIPRSSPPPTDADHFGAEIAEQCGAERTRNVAPEIEDANAVEHTSHAFLPTKPFDQPLLDCTIMDPSAERGE